MNLFDIMRSAGGGNAFAALAPHYGLTEEQVAKAVEAFLPAFSAGLKRSAADPLGLMELMRRLSMGDYARAFENPGWAWREGRREGHDALAFLFGSPAAAEAIARQASAFTGIAQEKLAELLPALAAMMFGGLAQKSAAANPILDAMLKQFQASAPKPGASAKGPLDRYEEEQEKREQAAADLARTQAEMMQAGLAAFQAGTAAWQQAMGEAAKAAAGTERPEAKASGPDVFGELFEPGLRLGEAYQREMEALLDRLRPETSRS
jgi:hypothetical protein